MLEIVVIAHDIRSAHNVGALLRTAEGLGVTSAYLTGYTPYPAIDGDTRLPHLRQQINKRISKTALGAEKLINIEHFDDPTQLINNLKNQDFEVVALEQTKDALQLMEFKPVKKVALLLGREVEGVEDRLLELCDKKLVIPMLGKKESFNVVEAASMAMFHIRFS